MSKNALILGATSDLAMSCSALLAAEGYALQLVARNSERLKSFSADISLKHGVEVTLHEFNVLKFEHHKSFVEGLENQIDLAICFFGILGDHDRAESDHEHALEIVNANYTGPLALLNLIAEKMKPTGKGGIIGISSVAGERGRQSNYFYGSAKAGFSAYLSGLRNRLNQHNIHVMTVKPGFMYTKMTEHLSMPALLTAKPNNAAKRIIRSWKRRKNIVYVKPIWALIMLIIRNIPEFIFKKLKL